MKTKYRLSQTVFIVHNNTVKKGKINRITIELNKEDTYSISLEGKDTNTNRSESEISSSITGLKKLLFNNIT